MPFFTSLHCRECGATYVAGPSYVCETCFGPLEVEYDYDAIGRAVNPTLLATRPRSMWRYRELLPIAGTAIVGDAVGFTPLVRAERLARRLGLGEVFVKNDAVNHPTLSFKDRVVSVATTRALELGFSVLGCASTGNLANAVAAAAASAGLPAYVFVPHDLEAGKIIGSLVYGATVIGVRGSYDQVNRLCSEIAGRRPWGFVNVNLRPYYAEGSKTLGYEVAEQLGWRLPDHVVAPMAGGSLITKVAKAFRELGVLGWVPPAATRFHGAQPEGCAPIVEAVHAGRDFVRPVAQPRTIVKSLAIGNPADGYEAIRTITGSEGAAEAPSDAEVVEGIRLLAECEGIFAETAGGTVVAAARRLAARGVFGRNDSVVLLITGNGLKTREAVEHACGEAVTIGPSLAEFDGILEQREAVHAR